MAEVKSVVISAVDSEHTTIFGVIGLCRWERNERASKAGALGVIAIKF